MDSQGQMTSRLPIHEAMKIILKQTPDRDQTALQPNIFFPRISLV